MKKTLNLFLLAFISLVFVYCGNKPEEVVEKYYTHFLKGEFDEAKKLVTEEHQGLCDLMKNFTPEEEVAKMAKTEVSVTNIQCESINDTISICTCQIKTTLDGEEKTMDEKVELKKINKNWYINQGKESNNNEEETEEAPVAASEEEILSEDSANIENTVPPTE